MSIKIEGKYDGMGWEHFDCLFKPTLIIDRKPRYPRIKPSNQFFLFNCSAYELQRAGGRSAGRTDFNIFLICQHPFRMESARITDLQISEDASDGLLMDEVSNGRKISLNPKNELSRLLGDYR